MLTRIVTLVIVVVLAVSVAACSSSSSDSPSGSGSGSTSAYCADRQALQSSYEALINTKVVSEGTNTLQTRFDAFTSDLTSLKDSAGSQFSSEVAAVQSSADNLKSVVDNADSAGVAATAANFVAGLGSFKTSVQALLNAVEQACQS